MQCRHARQTLYKLTMKRKSVKLETAKYTSLREISQNTHFSPKISRKRYHIEVPKRVSLVHAVSLFQTTTNPVPRGHNYRVYRETQAKSERASIIVMVLSSAH